MVSKHTEILISNSKANTVMVNVDMDINNTITTYLNFMPF
jgi:hypothetical protein